MLQVAKAHAYGNDFLFVPMAQAEALRLDELSRRLCERHTGVGGDGVIYYSIAPDGTARMKLINADGSPSELSGNGLRCLAALVLHQREQAKQTPLSEVRVDTDAGWKTLSLIGCQGSRVVPTLAANGSPAFGQYKPDPNGGFEPWALQVVEIEEGQIVELTFFLDTETLFPLFGLPPRLDA